MIKIYVQHKTCIKCLVMVFKNVFYLKIYQNIFLKKLFLISAHQNDMKIQKKLIWNKEKNLKKLNLKKDVFETQKQTKFYKI